jgi:ureidoglycolate lyase
MSNWAAPHARPLISIFRGRPYELPLVLKMIERHPLGSQAFYPLVAAPLAVDRRAGRRGTPRPPARLSCAPRHRHEHGHEHLARRC